MQQISMAEYLTRNKGALTDQGMDDRRFVNYPRSGGRESANKAQREPEIGFWEVATE